MKQKVCRKGYLYDISKYPIELKEQSKKQLDDATKDGYLIMIREDVYEATQKLEDESCYIEV